MAYKPSKRRRSHSEGDNLNLTPMIDILIIIIFFLLLTATFIKTAIIDIYLPQEGKSEAAEKSTSEPEVLIVSVSEKGFVLGGIGNGNIIPMVAGKLNYKELSNQFVKFKDKYPRKEDAVLLFDPGTPYDIVVKVMDVSRETSEGVIRPLFPQVFLGENR